MRLLIIILLMFGMCNMGRCIGTSLRSAEKLRKEGYEIRYGKGVYPPNGMRHMWVEYKDSRDKWRIYDPALKIYHWKADNAKRYYKVQKYIYPDGKVEEFEKVTARDK
jgi:hypothetical protein